MPITIPSISRRRFLQAGAAIAAGMSFQQSFSQESLSPAPKKRDDNVLAILADIHIHQNKEHVVHNLCVFDRFTQARQEILDDSKRPSRMVVCGDCAYGVGLKNDYMTMIEGFAPIREAGVPIHLTLGNHDSRKEITEALAVFEGQPVPEKIPDYINGVVELPLANLFLLDSLVPRNQLIGFMGEKQLRWLTEELDKRPDKPALLFAHHHPMPIQKSPGALLDTPEFFDAIRPRKQVKAYFYGHTHRWATRMEEDIHLVNIPTIVWRDKVQPCAWVLGELREDGMDLTIRSLEKDHPKQGDRRQLQWRSV